ncbi:RNA polymerase sigma-70 factor [Flavobacterium sp. AC]|uniref:RNA polymerase sigma-70 factor n=1 Tax=Flavobacterium azizsancarii TaxID=2961580 RepID=A0ABT4WAC5_9FLAO|nr:RNA polymerase sigma-70 factor [Flavobacterium azizsancarii]MDA6069528.1 RNA polymerase sigma-70 factor [Flavobacterium azizsancarii]
MKSDLYSDNTILLQSLKEGNEKAYSYLMDVYYHKLCLYADSLIRNIFAAEDIVQNVFLRLWIQRENLKIDQSFKSFLYKSVYNEFIDQYRKNQLLTTLEKRYFETLNAFVWEDNSDNFEQMLFVINKEIEKLPPKCKEIFILSKKEGLTNNEIADYLKITVKAVEAQITKAFSVLSSALEEKNRAFFFLIFSR